MKKNIININTNKINEKSNIDYDNLQYRKNFKFLDFIKKPSINYIKEYYKKNYNSKHYFIAIIKLKTGHFSMQTIATNNDYFFIEKFAYYIDPDIFSHDKFSNLPILFYHENISIPFKFSVNVSEFKDKIRNYDKSLELTVNPKSLKSFIISDVIEKLLKGAELVSDLAFLKKLMIINILISGVSVVILLKSLGIF